MSENLSKWLDCEISYQRKIDSIDVALWMADFLEKNKEKGSTFHFAAGDAMYEFHGIMDLRLLGGFVLTKIKEELRL